MSPEHTMIIGGTRGHSRALVRRLARQGHLLSIVGRRPPDEHEGEAPGVHYHYMDITDPRALEEGLQAVIKERGALTNLVFFQRYRGQEDAWSGELGTTLTATRAIIEGFRRQLDSRVDHSVVMVGSLASRLVFDEQPLAYHVAKAGLAQLTRYYAVELAALGVRVNCVSPGGVLREQALEASREYADQVALCEALTPLGRVCRADDIAATVAFLCSPDAAFITGQDIVLDGGLSLRGHESLALRAARLEDPTGE